MPTPPPVPPAPEEGVVVAWAVVDRDGCMWKAREVKASMEHERDVLNAYVDTGHYKACGPYRVVPLYSADVPALMSRLAAAEGAREEAVDVMWRLVRWWDDGGTNLSDVVEAARTALGVERGRG